MTTYILNNNVPLVDKSQEFKEQTINNGFLALSVLNRGVLTMSLNTPPGSPANESLYIVASGGTGDWSGKDDYLVLYYSGVPFFWQPYEGLKVFVVDQQVDYYYHSGAWVSVNYGSGANFLTSPMTTAGDLIVGGSGGSANRLGIGSTGQVLTATGSTTVGWTTPATGFANPLTTLGDILIGGASGTPSRLGISATVGQVLTVTGAGAIGWTTPSGGGGGGGGGSTITVSNSAPLSPADGAQWFSTVSNNLYIYTTDANSISAWTPTNTGPGLFGAHPLELTFEALPLVNSGLDNWAIPSANIANSGVTLSSTAHNGSKSGAFAGSSYLSIPSVVGDIFDIGSSDFTIEAWIQIAGFNGTDPGCIVSKYNGTIPDSTFLFYINNSPRTLGWSDFVGGNQSYYTAGSPTVLALNTWYHVAAVRLAGTLTTYVNGITEYSGANLAAYNSTNANVLISGLTTSAWLFKGLIDNLRFYRKAKYTGNFTPV